jgi:spoIIIJ-associated protein
MDERHRQSVTVSAKTVDEAIAEAERELGVAREHLDITVITEGSKGFLGMRSENARILAMVLSTAPAPTAPAAPAPAPRRERAQPAPQPVAVQDEPFVDHEEDYAEEDEEGEAEPGARAQERQETAAMAQEILETLLRKMEIDGRVSIRSASNPIVLDVETESGGLLIGRRGDTLSALQYIVNVLVGKRTRGWTKVVVDVEHWRSRREETLRALALRQADRVRQQRRAIALDPMPANERRIVHLTLQGYRDIETHSEGEEPNRRLVITLRR